MEIGLTPLFIMAVIFSLLVMGLVKDPIWSIAGYLIVYTLYNPDVWWALRIGQFLPRPSLIAAVVVAAATFSHPHKLQWKISLREFELYLFLALCWFVSFVFGVGVHDEARQYLEKMTKVFIFVFFLLRVVNTLRNYRIVLATLIACGILLAWQSRFYGAMFDGRLDNFGGVDFNEANGFAAFLALCICHLGFRFLKMPWWAKGLAAIGLAILLNGLILTQSRSIFLGMVLAVPAVVYRTVGWSRIRIIVAVLLGTVLFFSLAHKQFWERMQTIQSQEDAGRVGRLAFWRASVLIFKDHPLGVGVKNFQHMIGIYDPQHAGRDAHNSYVLCYSELGVLGIGLFLVIITKAVFQTQRIIRLVKKWDTKGEDILFWAIPLEATFIIYLLGYMMTHSNLYTEMLWILLALPICFENAWKLYGKEEGRDSIGR
ncbi:MAG: O-antigen ligase family protein [Desulfosoma sp.]